MIILQYRRTQPSLLRWTNDSITLLQPRGNRLPVSRFWLLFTLQVYFSFPDTLLPGPEYFAASFMESLLGLSYWMLADYRIGKQQRRHRTIDRVLAVVICAMKPFCAFYPAVIYRSLNVLFLTSIMIVVWRVHGYYSQGSQHYVAKLL